MILPPNVECISDLIHSQYGLEVETITFMHHSGCMTYRFRDEHEGEYVFRAHSSISDSMNGIWQKPSIINSEMIWLNHLHSVSNCFQKPFLTREGTWVAHHENKSGNHLPCTLLQWVDGECPRERLTSEEARQAAILLARLHDVSTNWTPPADFIRPSYNEEHLRMATAVAQVHKSAGNVPAEEVDAISGCITDVVAIMSILGESTDHWGMIHGDFAPSNLIFQDGLAIPIDFAECGYGHYLLDVAKSLLHLGKEREIFFKTYALHRPLPENHVRLVDAFCIANIIYWLAFTASLPDRYEKVAGIVKDFCIPGCRRFINGERFFRNGLI